MANYELITISKGTINTVDSFIKNFNAIGTNMKALSVSAYGFLTSEDKEVKKDFQIRVMDELHMSKATLSYLKTAGWLYTLDDRFGQFAYTNVIYFKKAIEHFQEVNECEITEKSLTTMFKEIAMLGDSRTDNPVNFLASLSQKELDNIIKLYVSRETSEVVEEVQEVNQDEVEEVQEVNNQDIIDEVNNHIIQYIDDDINLVLNSLDEILSTPKMSKASINERVKTAYDIISESHL